MKTLTIRKHIDFPHFGLWKWNKTDYKKPLVLAIQNTKVYIYIEEPRFGKKEDLVSFFDGWIEIQYSPPPKKLLAALKSKLNLQQARGIHNIYIESMEKFEALLMSAADVKFMLSMPHTNLYEFYKDNGLSSHNATWQLDSGAENSIDVVIPKGRGRNELFKIPQLVTTTKWQKIQDAADNSEVPDGELLELYKIRSKAGWRQTKVATIEASIISESLLRKYGLLTLKKSGFSNNKIKKLKDELSFNNLLNIVLPLSLSKSESKKVAKAIQEVDTLRGIRNNLIHGDMKESEVSGDNVMKGIEASIKLANFLRDRINEDES